jgi:hypothetical protein
MRARGLVLATVLAFLACTPKPASAPFHGLPFIENDFDAALAKAQQAAVPLFVEVWAPW